MRQVGAFEAKNTLGALLDLVERGEDVIITRHGKPVARLMPHSGGMDREQSRSAAARIRARATTLAPGAFDWEVLKADRAHGRP